MSINFVAAPGAGALGPDDIASAAASIGVPANNLAAVVSVETSGSGFDAQMRPTILFEPAVFYRQLQGAQQTQAVEEGLAAPAWGQIPYAPTSDANYARLQQAMLINESAALAACSWGLGQIMGENYAMVGYTSVQAMVAAAVSGVDAQLTMMCRFIVKSGAAKPLAAGDWASFARIYNGPGYAKNHYDTKLAAYAAAAAIPAQVQASVDSVAAAPEPETADQLMAAELSGLTGAAGP
jgi:hypothetical protein